MSWASGITVFVCTWWVVLFAVLPFGVRATDETDPGFRAGAPVKPMLGRKALATTVIAAALWIAIDLVIMSGWISLRDS